MDADTLEYLNEATQAASDSVTSHMPHTIMRGLADSVAEAPHDTLHLPSLWDNFFSMSSKLWHGDVSVSSLGEQGVLIPYSASGDDVVNIVMLLCIILSAIYYMLSKGFISYQLYNILHAPREGGSRQRETIRQAKYLDYFVLQWAVLAAVMLYTYVTTAFGMLFIVPSWAMIGIYAGIILFMTIFRDTLRKIPHSVYFDMQHCRLYQSEHATYRAYNGMLILPFAILSVYLSIDIILLGKILLSCLAIVKIIEFSKVYSIFFRKNSRYVRFFLYLCTLEAVPILLMVGILAFTTLILNYG